MSPTVNQFFAIDGSVLLLKMIVAILPVLCGKILLHVEDRLVAFVWKACYVESRQELICAD